MFINIRDRKWLTEAARIFDYCTPWAVVLNFRLFMHLVETTALGQKLTS